MQEAQVAGTKPQAGVTVIVADLRQTQLIGADLVELVVRKKLHHVVVGVTDVLAADDGHAMLVAGQHQGHVGVLLDDVLINHHTVVGEVRAAAIRASGRLEVGVGQQDGVAVGVLLEHLIRPRGFLLSDVIAQVQGDEVHAVGGKQVIVVVVIALSIGVIRGILLSPLTLALLSLVALRTKVLVVEVVGADIRAALVVVVARQHAVDHAGVLQNLLGVGGYLEFLLGICPVIARANPVLDDVTGVCGVGDLALLGVIGNPLGGRGVAFFPLLALLGGGLFYRALGEVLGIGVVSDGEVIVTSGGELFVDGLVEVIGKDVVAHQHGVDGVAVDEILVDLRAEADLGVGCAAGFCQLLPAIALGVPGHEAH